MLVGRGALDISLYADSAVGRDVQPLFIPEVEGPWSVTLMPAFRVGRLGKSVPEKFAARYIDGVSVVALMHPTAIPPRAGAVPGWLSVMDSAVTTGHWLPFDATATVQSAAADCVRTHGPCVLAVSTTAIGGVGTHEPCVPTPGAAAISPNDGASVSSDGGAAALARASAWATLKTGDVILPPCGEPLTLALVADTVITAAINGQQVIRLKVK